MSVSTFCKDSVPLRQARVPVGGCVRARVRGRICKHWAHPASQPGLACWPHTAPKLSPECQNHPVASPAQQAVHVGAQLVHHFPVLQPEVGQRCCSAEVAVVPQRGLGVVSQYGPVQQLDGCSKHTRMGAGAKGGGGQAAVCGARPAQAAAAEPRRRPAAAAPHCPSAPQSPLVPQTRRARSPSSIQNSGSFRSCSSAAATSCTRTTWPSARCSWCGTYIATRPARRRRCGQRVKDTGA